mmetsp:Transcript_2456/g.5828  ORF Transcript_2456/g.5828 Transcript_2456/m.5828 type:complete len:201 (+) Transcript_2456:1314-1916(+)
MCCVLMNLYVVFLPTFSEKSTPFLPFDPFTWIGALLKRMTTSCSSMALPSLYNRLSPLFPMMAQVLYTLSARKSSLGSSASCLLVMTCPARDAISKRRGRGKGGNEARTRRSGKVADGCGGLSSIPPPLCPFPAASRLIGNRQGRRPLCLSLQMAVEEGSAPGAGASRAPRPSPPRPPRGLRTACASDRASSGRPPLGWW